MEDQKLENKIEDEQQKRVNFNPYTQIFKSKEEKSQKEKNKKKQDKYDNEAEMSIHDIFEEAKSMIDDYEEGFHQPRKWQFFSYRCRINDHEKRVY